MTDQVQNFDQSGVVPSTPPADLSNTAADNIRLPAPLSITLMKIDTTLVDYLQNVIAPAIVSAGLSVPVPVLYGNMERWAEVRKFGALRDPKTQKALLPRIMLRRTSMGRNPLTSPVNKYLDRVYETGWNRHNTYDRFDALNGINPPREIMKVKLPDYVDLTYEVLVWTESQEQNNAVLESINFEADEFWGRRDAFKFRVAIREYTSQNDLPPTEDRVIRTTFNMEVKAYLLPERTVAGESDTVGTTRTETTLKKIVTFVEINGAPIIK